MITAGFMVKLYWNESILEKFYKEPSRYAFAFQMMAYVTRFKRLYTIYKKITICKKLNYLFNKPNIPPIKRSTKRSGKKPGIK